MSAAPGPYKGRELNQRRRIEAALSNETITRGRVEALETAMAKVAGFQGEQHACLTSHEALLTRGFWGRLKWLVSGR